VNPVCPQWQRFRNIQLLRQNTSALPSIIGLMQPVLKLHISRALVVWCAVAVFSGSLSAKDFVKPVAHPAKTYPAHDDHTADKVAIAADPYDTPDKAKIFSVNFQEHGFLPIFFLVTNDGDQPISIATVQVTLTTASRAKLTPITPEDIFRRLNNAHANTHPIPVPIPQKKVKGGISQKERDEIESSQFAAKAVEPHTTQSGFFFFDVEDVNAPLEGAHLYVTGVNDAKGAELMYFEIQMEK
jgi:nicotinamidase-related amidase